MGLAAPKNKIKISHDPNNTRWTNDTSSFGHKIMTSQGWQPGQYLGAKDAAHAEFHTAANASHIRVSIKDDNLGLGAKIGSGVGHGECTGLDVFKNLLGRLNGKDEDELVKEQKARDDLRVAIYTERKWGATRFVSGGFLIGDKIQYLIDAEAERIRKLALGSSSESTSESESDQEAASIEKPKKSKKRKLEVLEDPDVPIQVAVKAKKSKKERKADAAALAEETAELSEVKRSKKSKKDCKSKSEADDTPDEAELKRRRKQEKKEKKERKQRTRGDGKLVEEEANKKKKSKKDKHKEDEDSSETSQPTTKESTPATPLTTENSGRSTPIMMQGRHAVRARNIAQKRMASMDTASLNQIFMIKT